MRGLNLYSDLVALLHGMDDKNPFNESPVDSSHHLWKKKDKPENLFGRQTLTDGNSVAVAVADMIVCGLLKLNKLV